MITFTHRGGGGGGEEEKYSGDGNEGEAEEEQVRRHDENDEDVKAEEAEEKCRVQRVYLGHLRLHPRRPLPPRLSLGPPSPPYCSSANQRFSPFFL